MKDCFIKLCSAKLFKVNPDTRRKHMERPIERLQIGHHTAAGSNDTELTALSESPRLQDRPREPPKSKALAEIDRSRKFAAERSAFLSLLGVWRSAPRGDDTHGPRLSPSPGLGAGGRPVLR